MILKNAKIKCRSQLTTLKEEYVTIRAGRANPHILRQD